LVAADQQQASELSKGHGRLEKRTLRTTTLLNDYLDWPSVGQVFWLRRERTVQGKTTVEDLYGLSSLPRAEAPAGRLLELLRAHWQIENGLHYVRDVTLGEDACRVHTGSSAGVLAGLRNAALVLLDRLNLPSVAAAVRACVLRPKRAFRLLFGQS
jgi:DDE family transposase